MIYVTLLGLVASLGCCGVFLVGNLYDDPLEDAPLYIRDAVGVLMSVGSLAAPLAVVIGLMRLFA